MNKTIIITALIIVASIFYFSFKNKPRKIAELLCFRSYRLKFWALLFDQQSLQYIGLSGDGSKGSSVISFLQSAHFQFPLTISRGEKSLGPFLNLLKAI